VSFFEDYNKLCFQEYMDLYADDPDVENALETITGMHLNLAIFYIHRYNFFYMCLLRIYDS